MNGVLLVGSSAIKDIGLLIDDLASLVLDVEFRVLNCSARELVNILHVLRMLNTDLVELFHRLKWVQ